MDDPVDPWPTAEASDQGVARPVEQAPPQRGRFIRIINAPAFWGLVTVLLGAIGFYYHTYTQCVADARDVWSSYISLEMELFQRQNAIAGHILEAKSVSELRKSIDEHKYFDAQYKDKSTVDLHTLYVLRSERIDESGINKSAENEFANSKFYQRFSPALYGPIGPSIKDADLKDLQEFAAQFIVLQLVRFLTALRSETVIACIPANVYLTMLGEKPVTIQRYDTGSFVAKELSMQRSLSGRNFLPRKTPPAPFPSTTYKPDVQPAQPQ
jgi:hypothetical protein